MANDCVEGVGDWVRQKDGISNEVIKQEDERTYRGLDGDGDVR